MLETVGQIILGVLTFLGITLLVVLGIILLMLLLVLFVPIRYNGEFVKDAEHMQVQVNVTWLLRFVRAKIYYEKELLIKAFVLFFRVYDSSAPKKVKTSKKDKSFKNNKEDAISSLQEEVKNETQVQSQEQNESMEDHCLDVESDNSESTMNMAEIPTEENHGCTSDENFTPKPSFFENVKVKIQNIICKIKTICDKIKSIVQNINYYIEIVKADETKALLGRSKTRLFKMLKSIRPRKLKADLVIGTGSPDSTGYLMAVGGMLYPVLGRQLNIVPDFENTIFEGNIYLKGRITVFMILIQALKIILDKELRKLLKKLKREDT